LWQPPPSSPLLSPSDRSSILELDPYCNIIAIHVERDFHILGVQERTGRVVKASDLAAGQDEPTSGVRIPVPA
jgi:hypothetical protein